MEHTATKQPKFVRWALMLGIVIILNIFFTVLVNLALPAPDYAAYCPMTNAPAPTDAATCDAAGGTWTDYGATVPEDMTKPVPASGYCDMYTKCQAPYQTASDTHNLYAFALMVGLGILALIIGLMPLGSSIVSTGLSYGGVLAFVIGSASYWGSAGNWIRLLIAAIGLGALLYIGWRNFRD